MMGGIGNFPNSGHRTALKLSLIFLYLFRLRISDTADQFSCARHHFAFLAQLCHCVWHLFAFAKLPWFGADLAQIFSCVVEVADRLHVFASMWDGCVEAQHVEVLETLLEAVTLEFIACLCLRSKSRHLC